MKLFKRRFLWLHVVEVCAIIGVGLAFRHFDEDLMRFLSEAMSDATIWVLALSYRKTLEARRA